VDLGFTGFLAARFGADFFADDFRGCTLAGDNEVLADTPVAPAGLVTDLAARNVAIMERLNFHHSGTRICVARSEIC
jgi:hypothetical protein